MLDGKKPLREKDFSAVRGQARHGPLDTSRRNAIVGGAAMVAAFGLPMRSLAYQSSPASGPAQQGNNQGETHMNMITTKDGTKIYFKDWGTGRPVVFSHGWPLSADAWDAQMMFLGENGYRVIAHDRRGHGRSSQPWNGNEMDTYADDLAALIEALDLRDATLVGHSTGGGEVARYIGRHGSKRVSKAVLIGAVPPLMLKTKPTRRPADVHFDQIRAGVVADRSQFFKDLTIPFYGYNKPDAKISQGVMDSFWLQGMQCLHQGRVRLHQGVLGDGLHRRPEEDRRANVDFAR
jgi:non-heme chloroperoxidase